MNAAQRPDRSAGSAAQRPVRPATARAARLARAASAFGVVVLAAAVVAAGAADPVTAPAAVGAAQVSVPPGTTRVVCPGPVQLSTSDEAGQDVGYDPSFDPAPVDSATLVEAISLPGPGAPSPAVLTDLSGAGAGLPTVAPSGGAAAVPDPAGSLVLTAEPVGEVPPLVAASMSTLTPAGDLRGLAAASCAQPAGETWLVGGGTELGTSARLVVQNPGRTPATVTLHAWGAGGAVEAARSGSMLVPAGGQRALLIEGIAAEQPRLVLQLVASGGLVTAYLQDSVLRGFTPAGIDYVTPGVAPALRQAVPGLALETTAPDDPDSGLVRILAPGQPGRSGQPGEPDQPGDSAGTATVRLLGPDGPVTVAGATDLKLPAGVVVDVPLSGIPAGRYTALIEADVPIVAGALLTRVPPTPDAPAERAWAPSVMVGGAAAVDDGEDTAGVEGADEDAAGRTLSLLALPRLPAVDATVVISAVPPSTPSSTGQDAALTGRDGRLHGRLEGIDAAGTVVGSQDLAVPFGQSTTLDVADLGPHVVALRLVSTESDTEQHVAGAGLVWAVALTADAADGQLIAVLPATSAPRGSRDVSVRLGHGTG